MCDFLPEGLHHGKEGYALVSLQCACRVALGELAWGEGLLGPRPGGGVNDADHTAAGAAVESADESTPAAADAKPQQRQPDGDADEPAELS